MGQTILTSHQSAVLEQAANDDYITSWYYFTGGTALAAFWLHHRFSEDLDFFTERDINEPYLRSFFTKNSEALHVKDIKEIIHHDGMVIFYLTFTDDTILKIDVVNFPYRSVEHGSKFKKLSIDSAFDIALNKLYTMSDRVKARDYVDLYCILMKEDISFDQILERMNDKFHPFTFEAKVDLGIKLLRVVELADFPTMLVPFDKQKMIDFYLNEAKKLEPKIFK